MIRNQIKLAATSGLVGLSVFAGSFAYAATGSDATSSQELQQFLKANPQAASAVSAVESKTGGKVAGAEFDDETKGNGIVEFEVMQADGTEQSVLYTLADGSMTVKAADDGADDESNDANDNESDEDDGDGDGETNDDN